MARRRDLPENPEAPRALEGYLLPSERLVVAIHQHWAVVAPPVLVAVLAFVLAIEVDMRITPATQAIGTACWWIFFATLAYAGYRLAEWRHSWFAATDKRLLLTHGFLTHKVSMMPLTKVTDMSFTRTVPARLMGYGLFVLESAGQDQALREINWVPEPEATYRAICAEIFGGRREDRAAAEAFAASRDWADAPWDDGQVHPGRSDEYHDAAMEEAGLDPETGLPLADNATDARVTDPATRDDDAQGMDARPIRVDPGAGVRGLRPRTHIEPTMDGESIYRSKDEGDTGPIRYYP